MAFLPSNSASENWDYQFGGKPILFQQSANSLFTQQQLSSFLFTKTALASAFKLKTGLPQGSINGFVFDYFGNDEMNLESDIRDHWAEDNSSIQDHSAQKPIIVTLRGLISEVSFNPFQGVIGKFHALESKMATVPAYLGKYTPGALQKIQGKISSVGNNINTIVNEITQYANQGENLVKTLETIPGVPKFVDTTTEQQKAFADLYSMWINRIPVSVSTPWANFMKGTVLPLMLIQKVRFFQSETTPTMSDISITLKQLRTVPVSSKNSPVYINSNAQAHAGKNLQPTSYQGTSPGVQTPFSQLNLSGTSSVL